VPRPATSLASDGLPLWDTFEALFFFVAGLSAGVVLGILLPSLWRTLRRRFRRIEKVAPLADATLADVMPRIAILRGAESDAKEGDADYDDDGSEVEREALPHVSVVEAFVYARYLTQEGKAREAVRVYLDLLKHDRISKGQTNRALFELAQCYVEVGLEARALDTFLELHHRKPEKAPVLLKAIALCCRLRDETRLQSTLTSYRGVRPESVREAASTALCFFADEASAAGNSKRALELARQTLRWENDSAHGRALLWRLTGAELWQASRASERAGDAKALWSAFAADWRARYDISRDTGLSPAAECGTIAERIAHLAALPEAALDLRAVRREFRETAGTSERDGKESEEKLFEALVVYGFLELFRYARMAEDVPVASLAPLLLSPPAATFVARAAAFLREAGPGPFPLVVYFLHECSRCQALVQRFRWTCPQCGGQATLQTVTPQPWTASQPTEIR